jgi:hypothetical protein
MALHWGNLLHPDPQRNSEIVDGWADMLLRQTTGAEWILAGDAAACWRQSAVSELAVCRCDGRSLCLDLRAIPNLGCFKGPFYLKIFGGGHHVWQCVGGRLGPEEKGAGGSVTLSVLPEKDAERVTLLPI